MMKNYYAFRLILLFVVIVAGSVGSWAVNTDYRIVNNKGEVCFIVRGTTAKPELPSRARTPYATNYRYYLTLQEAQRDARYGAALAASTYGAQPLNTNVNLSGNGDVYVRYDYTSSSTITDFEGNVVRIDGKVAYNLQVNDRLVYYSTATSPKFTTPKSSKNATVGPVEPSADEPIRVTHSLTKIYNGTDDNATNNLTDAIKNTAAYKWIYDGTQNATNNYEASLGHPDPYDLRIINLSDRSKVLTGIQEKNFPFTPETQQYIHLTLATDEVSDKYVQRYFIRMNGVMQIAACEPMYVYLSGTGTDPRLMWFVLNKEKDEPDWMSNFDANYHVASLHLRLHGKQETNVVSQSGNRSTCQFHALKNRKYTVVGSDGTTRATAYAPVSDTETLEVPFEINSPLVSRYTYHKTADDAKKGSSSYINISDFGAGEDVFVGYSYNSSNTILKLNDATARYTMQLNGNYLKYQEGAGDDSDVTVGTEDESENTEYRWKFSGSDPYGILVSNDAASSKSITGVSTSGTITLGTGSKAAALQGNTSASSHTPYRYYLVKSPNWTAENPLYILRAASVGTEELRYNWGYVGEDQSDWNESQPRLAASTWLGDGNAAVQLQLDELRTTPLTYHIVDLKHTEVTSAKTKVKRLAVPNSIKSPLVSTYYYYGSLAEAQADNRSEVISSTDGKDDIFVTYDVDDEIYLNVDVKDTIQNNPGKSEIIDPSKHSFYMLKFLNPNSYIQEDGKNGITDGTHSLASPPIDEVRKAEIPYANGDACMNIYNETFANASLNGGASTRTRMPWGLMGGDPYHVKIVSYQNSHNKKTGDDYAWYFTYFRTYYNTDTKKVITTNVTDDPKVTTHAQFGNANAVPSEYMILGSKGKYKLVTTEKINDGTTTEHRTLHSFEQYWKNYETIGKQFGQYEGDLITSMPSDGELQTMGWYKYPAWANAKPLDGGSKSYEYQNHWFQTFEVGEEFDLIPISLKPSIVLVDKHGWEIFRYAMPDAKTHTKNDGTDYNANDNYIRTYNSPAVKTYHWYKKAAKLSGYHKYKVSDPAMKNEEEEFTSTDLTIYPENYATNPGDWYVTYDVKDEYKYLYDNASGHAAPVLIKQGGKFAKAANETAIGSADGVTVSGTDDNMTFTGNITNDMLWYLKRNTSIDEEMGYLYAGETGAQSEAKSKADTEEQYTDDNQSFDPYNVQIKNADNGKFFKTQAKTIAINSGGSTLATYDDRTLVLGDSISDAGVTSAVGHDNVAYKSTNATFMILKDSKGNLRLVPRLDHMSAVTNLTSSAKMNTWVYDTDATGQYLSAKADSVTMQAITLQPIQKYKFYVRDINSNTIIAQSSAAFYARPGSALASGTIGKATGIPLPDDLIRSYCDYSGAYTTYDATNNTYDNKITCYPPGAGTGIAETPIYVRYTVEGSLFSTAATPSWYNMGFINKNRFHMMNTTTSVLQSGGLQAADESKWMLIGNPYQFKLVNKAQQNSGYYLRIPQTNVEKQDNNGLVNNSVKPTVSNDRGNNDWTLVYMVDTQGNVHEQLRTYDKQYTLDGGTDTYHLYVRDSGQLIYSNYSGNQNYTDADVFLTNLITVTYHVFKDGSWTTAEYEEAIDYEPQQLAEIVALPSSVYRPLCQYTFYRTEDDMKADNVNGYENFSAMYTAMSDADKAINFDIYLSYVVNAPNVPVGSNQPVKFFATEEEAAASMEWSFLMQGLESAAKIYGKKLVDYGKARAYGTEDRGDWGEDVEGLTEAEKSFVQYTSYNKIGGFHFLRHNTSPTVDSQSGSMTVPDGISEMGLHKGTRYIPSQNTELDVCLMSPLNDFRRIAETYKDGSETSPRTDSWLWAFIGTPYKFEIINREALAGRVYGVNGVVTNAGTTHKRLAIIRSGTTLKDNAVKLVADYTSQTDGKDNYPHYWTLAQLAPETMPDGTQDPETPISFAIKAYGEDYILTHNSGTSLEFKMIPTPAETDISYLKSTGFMAHPWNWSDNKYKTVTVNIYKDNTSGTPVLTKTYRPADRAFIAGDVIDGTDGHFYLPVEAKADGSWKPMGVFTNTVPYDKHLINIPYELRRRYCTYSVANGNTNVKGTNDGFTIQDTDEEQIINIVYTLEPYPVAPHFVAESELASFRSKADNAVFKDGAKKKDYYYFLDLGNDLGNHAYVENGGYYPAKGSNSRYDASDPAQLMYYFVGDPYQLRICNAYTDNVGAYNNLARNVWQNGSYGAYGSNADNDNRTYMAPESDSRGKFYWEMVDAQTTGSYGYNAASSNVDYRLDYLQGKAFALRTKNKDAANATYYYLGKNSYTYGSHIYKIDGETVGASLNQIEAFRNFPDVHHLANLATNTTMTAMRPATVYVSVYDQDEPTRLVTKNELSEYYALTERFTGVPANLQRNYCNYTWASTSSDTKSPNMLDGGYFTINDKEITMYAKYVETDDSPFSRLDDNGVPVLKRDANISPWYNMSVNNRWAFFNSNLDGMTSPLYSYNNSAKTWNNLRPNTGGKPNNSVLSFPYNGAISTVNDRFHKGMHWALVGDPYNFQIRCQRDIITFETIQGSQGQDSIVAKKVNGDYEYTPAYLNGTQMDTQANGTWWTWMRNRNTTNYFLSESPTRRTAVTGGASAKANSPHRLPTGYPSDPSANPATNTLNLKTNGESGTIESGNNYALGDVMRLVSVDDVDANNEAFDAVVIVYNKVNEPVATTGWTELIRKNVTGNGEIPGDVKRWGCTYHYWADETMTLYPFTSFNQTDANGNYLIKDGGIVYVTYDYDESLYSSENEYRWVNIFFNWDDIYKQWNEEDDNSVVKYTAEYCEYDKNNNKIIEGRHTYPVKVNDFVNNAGEGNKAKKYTEQELYRHTKTGWISSPATNGGGFDPTKAWAYEGRRLDTTPGDKDQKWAMIGDPYRFILYNYRRKVDADSENAYYLYYDEKNKNVRNVNFNSDNTEDDNAKFSDANPKATKQGIYWTWKVDGTDYRFANNSNSTTEYYKPNEVPSYYYHDAYYLTTGYLGVCDMTTTSLYDVNNLLGAVKGYATFNHERYETVENEDVTSTYTKGYNEKYRIYTDDSSFDGDKTRDYTSWDDLGDDASAALALWRSTYGAGYTLDGNVITSEGTYKDCYIGPNMEPEKTVTVNSYKQEWHPSENVANTEKYLGFTGGPSVKSGGSTVPSLVLGTAERFLVVPMTDKASSVTFHLDTNGHTDSKRNFATNPIPDHTTTNFGVDNTIILPWTMRRQYCDYKFYVVKDANGKTPADDGYNSIDPEVNSAYVDKLKLDANYYSNEHTLGARSDAYENFWKNCEAVDLKQQLTANNDLEVTIPDTWKDKHIYLVVKYEPTAEFKAMQSTSTDGSIGDNSTVRWLNIVNQEKGKLLRYTRSNGVTGENTDQGEHTTNDYLWAIEGDPYGFILHNRYADHGIGTTANKEWKDVYLKTPAINVPLKFNTKGEGGITYGASGTSTAYGKMTAETDKAYSVYEAMIGNYDNAMLIHPIDASINIMDENGYKYSGAFLFNGAPTDFPVQLNYLQEWEAMRNVYCNWRLQRPTKEQLLPYYNRAGYVGGLKADVATNAEFSYGGATVNVPDLFSKLNAGTATNAEFNQAWAIVHDPANIVPFEDGFYRIRAYSADNQMVGGQYVSGYLHQNEMNGTTPLHLHEKQGVTSNYTKLESYDGNEWMEDYVGKTSLEVLSPENDPASIFYITRDNNNYIKMQNQGMVVSENMLEDESDANDGDKLFQIQDIGLTAFQLRSKANEANETSYLSCSPNTIKHGVKNNAAELGVSEGINDGMTIKTHDTMWLLQKVGTGTGELPLNLKMNNGKDDYYYSTFCAPYDIVMPEGVVAFIMTGGITDVDADGKNCTMELVRLSNYTNNDNYLVDYRGKDNYIPANTPVVLRAAKADAEAFSTSGVALVTLPNKAPSSVAPSANKFGSNLLSGTIPDYVSSEKQVYVFGMVSNKVGFYVNATKNPVTNVKDNTYVPHHKAYLVYDKEFTTGTANGFTFFFNEDDFVPEPDEPEEPDVVDGITDSQVGTGDIDWEHEPVYDLHGRRVYPPLHRGVYIVRGKKFVIK